MWQPTYFNFVKFVSIAIVIAGCGTISPATVQLSTELTLRSKDLEKSHIAAFNGFFDSEQQRIDKFLKEKWIPLYLRNFLGTSQILEDLKKRESIGIQTRSIIKEAVAGYLTDPDEEAMKLSDEIVDKLNSLRRNENNTIRDIVKEYIPANKQEAAIIHVTSLLNVETPAVLIMDFAEEANKTISNQRRELLAPIEEARRNALKELSSAYADLYTGQAMITGRLEAAARKDQQQAGLINALSKEGTAAKINQKLATFSKALNNVFTDIESVQEKGEETVAASIKLINELKKGLAEAVKSAELNSGKEVK